MPRRDGPWRRMEHLTLAERLANDGIFQAHWYTLIAPMCAGKSVLDVGAGSGYGMGILRVHGAREVHGIDPFPLRVDVANLPIERLADAAWDVVVACDVIEHVEDDHGFLAQLCAKARDFVFFSTPNWNVSQAKNEFHAREYTPAELTALLPPGGDYEAWSSDDACRVKKIAKLDDAETSFGVLIRK